MLLASLTRMELLLAIGFAGMLTLWIGVSSFVVLNRLLYDRRERRLIDIARVLVDPAFATLPPLDRSPAIRRILSRLSRRVIYRMVASAEFPRWVTEACAAYSIEHLGRAQMVRDAATHRGRGRRKWRRISALFALGHIRDPDIHDLLAAAVCDADPEVSNAAAVVLHRIGDRRAAEILISPLGQGTLPPSRIATHLDQFAIPIHDLLRPLLAAPRPESRFWAVSLLSRYPDVPGLAGEIMALVDDPNPPVRKEALATLGGMPGSEAIVAARRRLDDPVAYVRATAVRTLGRQGKLELDDARRDAFASWIAPSMADSDWDVRLAAKESLVHLGVTAWPVIAAQLKSSDAFARNGAAEVLQNIGLLDWTIEALGSGTAPSPVLVAVLTRAFQEGGSAMIDAAVARSKRESWPAIADLLTSLRFVEAAS